jgi:hypothetical protein
MNLAFALKKSIYEKSDFFDIGLSGSFAWLGAGQQPGFVEVPD